MEPTQPYPDKPHHRWHPVHLLHERMTWAMLLGLALTTAVAWRRPTDVTGMPPTAYWAVKTDWRGVADVVLAGDSRTYRGVVPEVVSGQLDGMRVRNFGYSGLGFGPAYLDAVDDVLDPDATRPIIVLGITPVSLTDGATNDNGYLHHAGRSTSERFLARHFGGLLETYDAMTWREFTTAVGLDDGPRAHYYEHYQPDGWVAADKVPENPTEAIGPYSSAFSPQGNGKVSPEVVDNLLQRIRHWTDRGIRVFAFRVPSSADMVDLEDRLSGYPEADLPRRVVEAGGTWIDMDQDAYHSYDGSHLQRDAARRMSATLARRIQAHLTTTESTASGPGSSPRTSRP